MTQYGYVVLGLCVGFVGAAMVDYLIYLLVRG